MADTSTCDESSYGTYIASSARARDAPYSLAATYVPAAGSASAGYLCGFSSQQQEGLAFAAFMRGEQLALSSTLETDNNAKRKITIGVIEFVGRYLVVEKGNFAYQLIAHHLAT